MKTATTAAATYTPYPLRVIEDNVFYPPVENYLKPVKEDAPQIGRSIVSNKPQANDPAEWDIAWFASYE